MGAPTLDESTLEGCFAILTYIYEDGPRPADVLRAGHPADMLACLALDYLEDHQFYWEDEDEYMEELGIDENYVAGIVALWELSR